MKYLMQDLKAALEGEAFMIGENEFYAPKPYDGFSADGSHYEIYESGDRIPAELMAAASFRDLLDHYQPEIIFRAADRGYAPLMRIKRARYAIEINFYLDQIRGIPQSGEIVIMPFKDYLTNGCLFSALSEIC